MILFEPYISDYDTTERITYWIENKDVIESQKIVIDFTNTFFGNSSACFLIIPLGIPFYQKGSNVYISLRDFMFFDINPVIIKGYQIDEPLLLESQIVSNLPIVVNNIVYHPSLKSEDELNLSNLRLCLLSLDTTDIPNDYYEFNIDSYCRLPKLSPELYKLLNPSFWYVQILDSYREQGLTEVDLILNPELYYVYDEAPFIVNVDSSGAHLSSPLLDDISENHANENLAIRFDNEYVFKLVNNLDSQTILSEIITDNTIDSEAIAWLNRDEATFNIQFSSPTQLAEFVCEWLEINSLISLDNFFDQTSLFRPIVIGLANGDVYVITGRGIDLRYLGISDNILSFNLKRFRFWKVNTYEPFINWIESVNKQNSFPLTILKLLIVPYSFRVRFDRLEKFFVYFELLPKHYFMSNFIQILF